MRHESDIDLQILNFLLTNSGLAGVSSLPPSGECGGKDFNYVWAKGSRVIQILIIKSEIIHPLDLKIEIDQFKFQRPYCFLEYQLSQERDLLKIKTHVHRLVESATHLATEMRSSVRSNLAELKDKLLENKLGLYEVWKQKIDGGVADELKSRLDLLHTSMSKKFSDSCDKWNIPQTVIFPDDILSEDYKLFLSFDVKGRDKLFSEWLLEFARENKYP